MTANDFTMYPFSTQNLQDYKNLLSVYCDSVFFPLLRQEDFSQEGHRLDIDDNNENKIIYKGVVFNEMKGAMSDTSSLYYQAINNNLYNQSTYKYNSGGDPLNILDLTYNELKEFHKLHYHPNNCIFYSYGTFNPLYNLNYIENNILYKFNNIKKLKPVYVDYEPTILSSNNRKKK